jgi:toxin ParE1/3/4
LKAIIRLPRAIADLDDIWYYIAQDNPDAAFRTVQRISEATDRLRDHPLSGPALEGTGFRTISAPPYTIYYKVTDRSVLIVRVFHSARDVRRISFD